MIYSIAPSSFDYKTLELPQNNPITHLRSAHIKFFLKYWQGKIPLNISLWLVFFGVLISLSFIESTLLKKLFIDPDKRIQATFISLVLSRGLLFIWLLVGLFRASEKDFLEEGNTLKTRAIQTVLFFSVIFTLVYSIETIQAAIFNKKQHELIEPEALPDKYHIQLENNGTQLLITGELELGITSTVRQLIQSNFSMSRSRIKSVVLNSKGGNVHEGRGLSRTFSEYHLSTYVFDECSSACTTAFIGGDKRIIGNQAKIGFHQYRQDTQKFPKAVPYYDLTAEQERDMSIFRSRHIRQSFLAKMFDQHAGSMWFPDAKELLEAGVIHEVLKE